MQGIRKFRTRLLSALVGALVLFQLLPFAGLTRVFAAQPGAILAAAYFGAGGVEGTSLPTTLAINGEEVPVAWQIDADTFSYPYDTVTVNGTAGGTAVQAQVEVIPARENPLLYFIDAGHNGDSQSLAYSKLLTNSNSYEAVKTLAPGLKNEMPDGHYTGGALWGYDYSANNLKLSVLGGDPSATNLDALGNYGKYELGLRTNGNAITYHLSLEPGTYTLTSGFYEFYATGQSRTRNIQPVITYTVGGQETSVNHSVVSMVTDGTPGSFQKSGSFTIPEGADSHVVLSYRQYSGEAPCLSWLAVAGGDVAGEYNAAVDYVNSLVDVLVNGDDIRADNVNGLTFKGFGVLSANSTSALLMDYKSENPEAYAELMQVLFGGDNPIMTHVKIEMGNDRNTSTGPDPATMRWATEEANVLRHPGFQLAADAKAINPDVKVSILRWCAPGWANNNNNNIYKWYKNTLLAAYRTYGYMADYVNPYVNESWGTAGVNWTKQYAGLVANDDTGYISDDPLLAGWSSPEEEALYKKIKLVISDESGLGSFGGTLISDSALRSVVSVAAYHYNTNDDSAGNFKRLADQYDMEVWNSEAQATFGNSAFRPNNNMADPTVEGTGIGGTNSALEMANTIVKGYVNSRRTHFIYQPAIGSFYEGGQYSFKELVSARDPWSGWIHYDAALLMLQHFSDFAVSGWENDDNTAGIWRTIPQASSSGATGTNPVSGRNGLPNYMTLAAPDRSDFSTVIVNDSEYALNYRITVANMELSDSELEIWETRAADDGQAFNQNYKKMIGTLSPSGGVYTLTVKPYSIVTLTSLQKAGDAQVTAPLPVEGERTVLDIDTGDGILYADDYEYTGKTVPVLGPNGIVEGETEDFIASRGGNAGAFPLYTHDRNGAFEAYLDESGENRVLRQQLDTSLNGLGGVWNGGEPVSAVGDYRWMNYKAGIDVSFEHESTEGGANYAAIGARYQGGGSSHNLSGTPYALKFWRDGGWQLVNYGTARASGNVATGSGVQIEGFDTSLGAWHNIAIQVAGSQVTAYIDGVEVCSYTDPSPTLSGRVDLGTGYYHVRFDNLVVEKVEGFQPYYIEQLDNFEMHDLAETPNVKLVYSGNWYHQSGTGMYEYQRTRTTSRAAGARMEYTFTGTGLDIFGTNGGTARLDVYVDGQRIQVGAATMANRDLTQTFALRGLAYGRHTVAIEVKSGTLVIDSVGVVGAMAKGETDTRALAQALAQVQDIELTEEYREEDWAMFQAARAAVQQAVTAPLAYGLDAEGAQQLVSRLEAATMALLYRGGVTLQDISIAAYAGHTPSLPETVPATYDDGTETQVPVKWNLDGVSFDTAWKTVVVSGSFGGMAVKCTVEVVPEGLRYFADINGTAAALGYDSPAYTGIAALAQASGLPLLNTKPDQVYSAADGWGHFSQNSNGSNALNYKGIEAGTYSKLTTTGIYSSNQIGARAGFSFTLPAGDYSLSFGSHSWWAGNSRAADVYLEYDGNSNRVDSFTLNSASPSYEPSYSFTLKEDGLVTLRLQAITYAQAPMLSWAAVAAVKADKAALSALVETAEALGANAYSEDSWAALQAPLQAAKAVLAEDYAAQAAVNEAAGALQAAINALVARYSPADLQALAEAAAALELNGYTTASQQGFGPALEAALALLAQEEAPGAQQLYDAYTALQSAMDALVEKKAAGSPDAAAKEEEKYTRAAEGGYTMVSFKLYDEDKIAGYQLNDGDYMALTPNKNSDVNYIKVGGSLKGAVYGLNVLKVFDALGNVSYYEFILVEG